MKIKYPIIVAAPFAIIAAAVLGCGDGRPARVPVSGQVLIDGKPLARGYVSFVPQNARASSGRLDENGRFSLTCFEREDGVVLGVHRVEVDAKEPIGEDKIRWHAPKKYASAETSGLTEEIRNPTDSLVINLTWGSQPGPFVERAK